MGALATYILLLNSFSEWDWFTVAKDAVGHYRVSVTAVAVFLKPQVAANAVDVVRPLTAKNWFGVSVFESKDTTCDCTYSGTSSVTLAVANDLLERVGKGHANSAYRCTVHNDSLPGSSDDSYHLEDEQKRYARDLEVRFDDAKPTEVNAYLIAKYPKHCRIGLYTRFVHVDDRTVNRSNDMAVYACKSASNFRWKQISLLGTHINM